MRIDIDQTAIDLPKSWPAVDRRDRFLKRTVVEHRAIEEGHRRRVDAGAGNDFAMNSARRGQLPFLCKTTSFISTMRAGGNAAGSEDDARAAHARPGAVSKANELSTTPVEWRLSAKSRHMGVARPCGSGGNV